VGLDKTLEAAFCWAVARSRNQAFTGHTSPFVGTEAGTVLVPPNSFMILNFADNLDVLSFLSQDLPNLMDISRFADEGCKHHVYVLLHPELQILDVLF
jgi:hypothetical protein